MHSSSLVCGLDPLLHFWLRKVHTTLLWTISIRGPIHIHGDCNSGSSSCFPSHLCRFICNLVLPMSHLHDLESMVRSPWKKLSQGKSHQITKSHRIWRQKVQSFEGMRNLLRGFRTGRADHTTVMWHQTLLPYWLYRKMAEREERVPALSNWD